MNDYPPTARQVHITEAVVRWYLSTHYGTPDDRGVTQNFCDPRRVGAFAVEAHAIAERDGAQLFRLLVAVVMFQRRQDVQIARILRSLEPADVEELATPARLLQMIDTADCENMRSTALLREACDLTKDPVTKEGRCGVNPDIQCHLKRHTVLLRRYGHFGKVPSSAALVIREAGARDLAEMLAQVRASVRGKQARARALVDALSRAWRISEKISAMFLSMVTNPDLTPGVDEWTDVDWRHFIVIDSNVDLFLSAIGYRGFMTYEARRWFLREVSRRIDLSTLRKGLRRDNPRIVQQAMFLFMSSTNRRAMPGDCMHSGTDACARCPKELTQICPVRQGAPRRRRLPVVVSQTRG
ncbi:hypothetical protein [Polyangium aurulentum]|uniref:hypothetical protein n=1 Tax=Polyangium aurulentum TaxID=2567896 RepID=UPI0010ADEF57|nr:hypothetical protein [Polyangium aurulentum]UQA57438.1 hypothetical protein E8A73_040155 [Polyangium aurulentum]